MNRHLCTEFSRPLGATRHLDFQGAGETAPLWVASSLTSPVNRLSLGFSHRPPSTLFTTDSANDSQLEVKHRHLEQWGLILSLGVPGPHIPTLTPANTRTHARARTHSAGPPEPPSSLTACKVFPPCVYRMEVLKGRHLQPYLSLGRSHLPVN